MHQLLSDPHRRHFLLTLLSGAGLAAYLTGTITGTNMIKPPVPYGTPVFEEEPAKGKGGK